MGLLAQAEETKELIGGKVSREAPGISNIIFANDTNLDPST
jgi:hypothetical protein